MLLKLLRAVIPIGNLFRQAVLDRSTGFADPAEPSRANFLQVRGHDMGNCVAHGLGLQVSGDPATLGRPEQFANVKLARLQRPVVEIRGVLQMTGLARSIEFDVEHLL